MTIRAACVMLFAGLSCYGQERTASLSGTVQDFSGAVIPGTLVIFESETDPSRRFETQTDERGAFRLSDVPAGVYILRLKQAGFASLEIKAVELASGEEKSMPSVTLQVAHSGCGGPPMVSGMRFLPLGDRRVGNLAGTVVEDRGDPVAGANVFLICSGSRICGRTKSDSKGVFALRNIAPGSYGLQIGHTGFYDLTASDWEVREDVELTYGVTTLERCHDRKCKPTRRPIIICE